ncbi:MAG: response regulator [Halobacteriovoraceae bacterium]|nr:response regulator [Halobacteriovoraceae bacterium]
MANILIVDDTIDILELVKEALEEGGHRALLADRADDCIELLKQEKFDGIFLDIFLEEGPSTPILQFIKSDENQLNPNLPIVLISGKVDENFVERNKIKVAGILTKPFNMDELLSTANKIFYI